MIRRGMKMLAFVVYVGFGTVIAEEYAADVRSGRHQKYADGPFGELGDRMVLRFGWPVLLAYAAPEMVRAARKAAREVV